MRATTVLTSLVALAGIAAVAFVLSDAREAAQEQLRRTDAAETALTLERAARRHDRAQLTGERDALLGEYNATLALLKSSEAAARLAKEALEGKQAALAELQRQRDASLAAAAATAAAAALKQLHVEAVLHGRVGGVARRAHKPPRGAAAGRKRRRAAAARRTHAAALQTLKWQAAHGRRRRPRKGGEVPRGYARLHAERRARGRRA